ncbi:3-dehydroquinate synthase [Chryseomicrobium palamuruense]|uniref:3-dehydroquinate synthase n=1 Tax=Chryseomicrobium palamuruense TaxID=682973 RepID=A0ABV8UTE1_9BACL
MELIISTDSATYPVFLANGATSQLNSLVSDRYDSIFVFADETVWHHHADYFNQHAAFDYQVFVLPSGEESKSFIVYEQALTFLLENQASRKSVILAMGGGAVGDLTGFVAASYMRGISFIQLPTTILAHDSAVGGKTGINHPLGKNMVGAFHHPQAVVFDTNYLLTLPTSEVRSGFSELLKHALLSDANWVEELLLKDSLDDLLLLNWELELAKGISVKATIVQKDEFERHERKFLNLGHTYGHAIEGVVGFGRIKHGEAIALGLVVSLLLSNQRKLAKVWTKKLCNYGYPTEFLFATPFSQLLSYIKKDKKNQHGELHFVVLPEIGQPELTIVTEQEVEKAHTLLLALIKEETA